MSTRTALSRPAAIIAAIAALALSMLYFIGPVTATTPFNPGQDGHPTSGESSDLKGGTGTFTFQQNAILSCDGDTASSFAFHIDYTILTGGPLPAGAVLIVYLSPNQGAINNNGGSDPQGYIDDVQSNFVSVDISGLDGSGTLDVTVPVTTSFQLSGGGVLGVIAQDSSNTDVSNSKSNSVQCSEAQSVAESVPASAEQSVAASAEQSVAASGEQSVEAGTGTPAGSIGSGAASGSNSSPLPTIAFSLILLASLGTLAFANVKTVRNRL